VTPDAMVVSASIGCSREAGVPRRMQIGADDVGDFLRRDPAPPQLAEQSTAGQAHAVGQLLVVRAETAVHEQHTVATPYQETPDREQSCPAVGNISGWAPDGMCVPK
jgi:hypothetical protein